MPDYQTILTARDDAGIATVTLNRPEVRNAMNTTMMDELTAAFLGLSEDAAVRGIVIRGEGKIFCSGGDLNWMRDVQGMTDEEIAADSRRLQNMYRTIDRCPKPTIARVHGAAMAGGLGIVSCCDVAVAEQEARFSVSEVRLGLIPAIIAEFLLPRIGRNWLRSLSVSAIVFDGDIAQRSGLIHETASGAEALDGAINRYTEMFLAASPDAISMCKSMIRDVAEAADASQTETALKWNVKARNSEAAQEGIAAFLRRDKPGWATGGGASR